MGNIKQNPQYLFSLEPLQSEMEGWVEAIWNTEI